MPCYLFTFHTYGSWLPDHRKGFVIRNKGVQPTNADLAQIYKDRMADSEVLFHEKHQLTVIKSAQEACRHIACRLHFVATETTHTHLLVSWIDDKPWQQKRNSLKRKITLDLKSIHGQRAWLSEGGSRKWVRNRRHYEYLLENYLPSHRGWKFSEQLGFFLQVESGEA